MKKLISLALAVIMLLTLATVAFATQNTVPSNGTISISNVSVQKQDDNSYAPPSTYTAYRMLVLESYDTGSEKYNYIIAPGWEDFFRQDSVKAYLISNANGYIEWRAQEGEDMQARAAELAQLALDYVEDKSITGISDFEVVDNSVTTDASTGLTVATIKLDELELGYYLVDSTAGALCGLTTTEPDASFSAKNVPPTINKQVKEDGLATGSNWGKENDADVGQTVEFDATITVHAGAENYVFHDKMSPGLTFTGITSISHVRNGETHPLKSEHYTLVTEPEGGHCSFEIHFTPSFYQDVRSGDRIVILYTATLNENAVYTNEGNPNEAWLNYGNNSETTHVSTTTRTYGFDLVKITTGGDMLDGAKFKICTAETGDNALYFVKIATNDPYDIYRLATADEIAEANKSTEDDLVVYDELDVKGGAIRIVGLDKSRYWLEETVAPDNYNKLAARKEISLETTNFVQIGANNKPETNTGFQVINQSGSKLPETGAMGRTIFIGFGMIVMIGTGLLLVTKKRMSMIED